MSNTSITPTPTMNFANNFWESIDKNGITILIERMRGAKQTCEKYKHAYEARALLEEEYGKTLLQIAQKQKPSSTENGTSKSAMDSMQTEFITVAESHLHLSNLFRENVALPLSNLLNKQRTLRKNLQTSIQKLYNNRQLQVHFVRRAHKRHNMEIEKANLLVQQQLTEQDKRATFKMAEMTIDKLKKVYDEAVKDLEKIVEEWNIEWKNTCESFEKLEVERLEFFKSNISNCANLMVGCLENEVQACERINSEALKVDVTQDLVDFVHKNKSSNAIPTHMEYIKLHAYHEANQDRGDLKQTQNALRDTIDNESDDRIQANIQRKKSSIVSASLSKSNASKPAAAKKSGPASEIIGQKLANAEEKDTAEPVMIVGVMEVYSSGDEDEDESEYDYITESENEDEHGDDLQVEVLEVKESENKAQAEDEKSVNEDVAENEQSVNEKDVLEDEHKTEDKNGAVHAAFTAVYDTPIEENRQPTMPEVQQEQLNHQQPRSEVPLHLQENTSSPQSLHQDEKVNRLMSAYHQEVKKETSALLLSKNGFNSKRRVSFLEDNDSSITVQPQQTSSEINMDSTKAPVPTKTLDRFVKRGQLQDSSRVVTSTEDEDDYEVSSDAAALELDDMLRELDSKRISREEENMHNYRQPDIRPTASISSPSLTQQRQQRRNNIPSQYFQPEQQKQQYQPSRRMSTVDAARSRLGQRYFEASIRSNTGSSFMDLYDPFNSLSSKETGGTINSSTNSSLSDNDTKSYNSPPSVQMMHERMLNTDRRSISSSLSSSGESINSLNQSGSYRNDKFIQDFYSVGSKTPSPNSTVSTRSSANDGHFIDFAFALYDYEAADEGEISFKEGDLLGILSKSEEDEQGWWEASLLNRRNQRVVRTGVVPSNFLETACQ